MPLTDCESPYQKMATWEGVEYLPQGVTASIVLRAVFINGEWLEEYHRSQDRRNVRINMGEEGALTVAFVTSSAIMGDISVEERLKYALWNDDHLEVECTASLQGSGPVGKLHPTYRWEIRNDKLTMKLDIVFVMIIPLHFFLPGFSHLN